MNKNNDFSNILSYCGQLTLNNNRTWFHENHGIYEVARKEFLAFLDMFRYKLSEEAPDIGKSIMYMEPREWMYRIARDMRFYKDCPPYNPAFRAYISADKKSWLPIGYFLRIHPGSSCFGTGLWCESTAKMNSIRSYISSHYDEFTDALNKGGISLGGERLKGMPRGFSADDPAAEYIKHKHWEMIIHIPDEDIMDFENFSQLLIYYVRRMEPMRRFLLEAAKSTEVKRPEFEW
jgi:uncharacterized protein (TIGR02453 family)